MRDIARKVASATLAIRAFAAIALRASHEPEALDRGASLGEQFLVLPDKRVTVSS